MTRPADPHAPAWRVRHSAGVEPVPFHTERGARTHAAITHRDGRSPAPAVEHFADGAWHACPAAELIPTAEATYGRAGGHGGYKHGPAARDVAALDRRRDPDPG